MEWVAETLAGKGLCEVGGQGMVALTEAGEAVWTEMVGGDRNARVSRVMSRNRSHKGGGKRGG